MKILHLSDLHFHRNNRDNKQINKTLDTVNTKYSNHYIVITGDIVDDGHEEQYKNAPFYPISALDKNFNPRNTQCMPACPVECEAYSSGVVKILYPP